MNLRSLIPNSILSTSTLFVIFLGFTIITTTSNLVVVTDVPSIMQTVYAHISKGYGNITVEYGWSKELPLQNEINNIIIGVAEDSEENSVPIRNALTDMNIQTNMGV
ncbi:MAG: hypothetical protein WBX01_08095 [Nitrososphaeraceae archaeon]